MSKLKKSGVFMALIILISIIYVIFKIPVKSPDSAVFSALDYDIPINTDHGLLLTGAVYHSSPLNNSEYSEPALIHINPNNNFSIKTIDLKKFNFDFLGIHEARPIIINNEYKLALGSYYLDDALNNSAKLIILNNGNFGFDNLEMEFEEEVDDGRIRALYVEDIDNDGEKEVVIGTRPKGILKYYKLINNQWQSFQIDFLNKTIHDILIEDTDGNGLKEIIVTISPKRQYQFRLFYETNDIFSDSIHSYEFNPKENDWKKEIIWRYNNRIMSNSSLNKFVFVHARYLFVSDVDDDGIKEIIVNVLGTGNIELFRYNGTKYSREIIEDKINMHKSAIAIGDIDSDGKDEIIALAFDHDKLLMYKYKDGIWEREILMDDLIVDENRTINYLFIINSTDNSYAKILYAVELNRVNMVSTDIDLIKTDFYYLEHTNVWNKKHIATINQPMSTWGIFPAEN